MLLSPEKKGRHTASLCPYPAAFFPIRKTSPSFLNMEFENSMASIAAFIFQHKARRESGSDSRRKKMVFSRWLGCARKGARLSKGDSGASSKAHTATRSILKSWRVAKKSGKSVLVRFVLEFFATCLTASSHYVINEWLDAASDRFHPTTPKNALRSPNAFIRRLSGASGEPWQMPVLPFRFLSTAPFWR